MANPQGGDDLRHVAADHAGPLSGLVHQGEGVVGFCASRGYACHIDGQLERGTRLQHRGEIEDLARGHPVVPGTPALRHRIWQSITGHYPVQDSAGLHHPGVPSPAQLQHGDPGVLGHCRIHGAVWHTLHRGPSGAVLFALFAFHQDVDHLFHHLLAHHQQL
ncbi:hypothetical protein D3C75_901660 [compost metagenome]